jgi:hypothetical protein
LQSIQRISAAVVEGWAATSRHNRELLTRATAELAKVRAAELAKARAEAPRK